MGRTRVTLPPGYFTKGFKAQRRKTAAIATRRRMATPQTKMSANTPPKVKAAMTKAKSATIPQLIEGPLLPTCTGSSLPPPRGPGPERRRAPDAKAGRSEEGTELAFYLSATSCIYWASSWSKAVAATPTPRVNASGAEL